MLSRLAEIRVWSARARLASLWGSQVARVIGENALRLMVVIVMAVHGPTQDESAWHFVTAILMFPAVVFAPFNGALCNSLSKPAVLQVTSFLMTLMVATHLYLGWW